MVLHATTKTFGISSLMKRATMRLAKNNNNRGFHSVGGMNKTRARVLVVGSGRMGHIRSSLLYANPRFELAGVADVNFQSAASLASTYQTTPYETVEQALQDNNDNNTPIDGLVISSPTFTHDQVISLAANHGVDVFTEKPVDETADKIANLFQITKNAGIHLCCGFQRRFDPSYVAAAQAVQSGQIGRPVTARIFFADHPRPPPEFLLAGGGDIFMDLSAHDLDYILNAVLSNNNDDDDDDYVVSVYATGTSSTPELEAAQVHDNANMTMTTAKGTIITLFMSRSSAYGYDQRCEIFGESGLVSVENELDHTALVSNTSGFHGAKLKHSFPQRFQAAFATELNAFADTLLQDAAWPVTAHDCIKVQKVADAASLSCREGRIVELDNHDYEEQQPAVVSSAV